MVEGRKFAWDFVILKNRKRVLAVEIQGGIWTGGAHTRGKGYDSDCRKMMYALGLGLPTQYFTGKMVDDDDCFKAFKEVVKNL